jgi:hypothetical protein
MLIVITQKYNVSSNLYKVQVPGLLCPSGSDKQRVWADTLSHMSVHHYHRQHGSWRSLHLHTLNDRHILHGQDDALRRMHRNNMSGLHTNLARALLSQLKNVAQCKGQVNNFASWNCACGATCTILITLDKQNFNKFILCKYYYGDYPFSDLIICHIVYIFWKTMLTYLNEDWKIFLFRTHFIL